MAFVTTGSAPEEANKHAVYPKKKATPFGGLRVLLFLLSAVAFGQGILIMETAATVMQQIEGYLAFVSAAVFFSAAVIVEVLRGLLQRLDQ